MKNLLRGFRRLLMADRTTWGALRPARIDQLLYQLLPSNQAELVQSPSGLTPVQFYHYRAGQSSGDETIDAKLTRYRDCYVAKADGRIVHQSWLYRDVLLPGQFGYDADIPVIGGCKTSPEFRGQRIYPRMLRHIAADVAQRGESDRVYILVSPRNEASVRGIERAGCQRLARLTAQRFAGFLLVKRAHQA